MECSIYRDIDSREDDRCLVPLRECPSHHALGNIATVGDVGQRSAGLLSNLEKGKWGGTVQGFNCAIFPVIISFYTVNTFGSFLVDRADYELQKKQSQIIGLKFKEKFFILMLSPLAYLRPRYSESLAEGSFRLCCH